MNSKVKWKTYPLTEVARLVSGRTPDREKGEFYSSQGLPWVKIENLDKGVVKEAAEYLSEEGRKRVNPVPPGSVLFSTVGTVGKVGIAGCELAANQQIVALIFREDKVLPLFGYYCLRHFAGEIRRLADQTTMTMISRKTLGQYRIQIPEDLEVQRKIVRELEQFDTLIQQKREMRKLLAGYEEKLFLSMFGGEIRYHECLPLKEYLREPAAYGVPKGLDPEEEKEIPEKYRIQEGDLLIHNGSVLVADQEADIRYYDRTILCVRTCFGQLLPEVLAAYLRLPEVRALLYAERKQGDNRKRPIRPGKLEELLVPYFSLEKQKEFARYHRKITDLLRNLDEMLDLARQLFREMGKLLLTPPAMEREAAPERDRETEAAHLILTVLCGWCPGDHEKEAYCGRRQDIFGILQPYFYPAAIALEKPEGQEEFLLEQDFLAYRSESFVKSTQDPWEFLMSLLKKHGDGSVLNGHLVFRGERELLTETVWEKKDLKRAARKAAALLMEYSGIKYSRFLFQEEEDNE